MYRRSSTNPKHHRNQQNFHIAVGFEQTNSTVLALMNQGFTVQRILIEGAKPIIEVMAGPECEELAAYSRVTDQQTGRCRYRAFFDRCLIEWDGSSH